jgi:hypothetical protein
VKWLLDADVLSQPAKKNGAARVIAWIEKEQDSCYTSACVLVSRIGLFSDVVIVRLVGPARPVM